MTLTEEQSHIENTVLSTTDNIVAVAAVAGSGKTSLLSHITHTMKPRSGLYLAYNKSIATESKGRFPKQVQCMTTHSLAYQNTVRLLKLEVGFFTYRDIKEKIHYDQKLQVINYIENFCLSPYTSVDDYAIEASITKQLLTIVHSYLSKMEAGSIPCTHSFYLKLYHILLAEGSIEHDTFDIIMLDEAGDLNPVTLEIFKLLPAIHKVMVGDQFQAIYVFNNCINGFEAIDDLCLLPMTQSFRVSNTIAPLVEAFGQKHLTPSFKFRGVPYKDTSIDTRAYLTRTNGALIAKMIELDRLGIQYNLVRQPQQIFKLLLVLIGLKPGKFVSPEHRHLQDSTDEYYHDEGLRRNYRTLFAYLGEKYSDDINLKSAITTLGRYGATSIMSAYESAREHVGTHHPLTLATAHSSKGMEWDHVEIAEDFNTAIDRVLAIDEDLDEEQMSELRLYYVGCTRAKKQLLGARHLTPLKDTTCQN